MRIPRNLFRNANKRDILKAYRKKAQEWHPDNFSDENQKKIAEKNFVDIAAAKEVCSFGPSRLKDAFQMLSKALLWLFDLTVMSLKSSAHFQVLTDPEKRAQFDRGEDPLDPEQQQGSFHHPFQGGFPFGENGGPFSFQFHFG